MFGVAVCAVDLLIYYGSFKFYMRSVAFIAAMVVVI